MKAESGKRKVESGHNERRQGQKCHGVSLTKLSVITAFCACVTVWHCGCKALGNGLPNELSQVVTDASKMVADQGVLDNFKTNVDGHVQDPGVESYVSITCAAGRRLKGVNGNVNFDTQGGATHLPADVRAALIAQLDGPISDEQRQGILTTLGWNRTAPPDRTHGPQTEIAPLMPAAPQKTSG